MLAFLVAAGFFGFFSVVLAAIGAHHYANLMPLPDYVAYQVAVQYQLFHSIALLALGLFGLATSRQYTLLIISAWCFIIGIILFSGDVYLKTIFHIQTYLEPVGGIVLLIGWLCIFIAGVIYIPALKKQKSSS